MLKIGSKGLGLILACVLAGVLLVGCNNEPSSEKEGKAQAAPAAPAGMIGLTAPDFTLTDMQGQQVSLSQFRGKIVILNFWATWCPPCVAELPTIQKLYDDYGSKVSFVIATREAPAKVKQFIKDNGYTFPVYIVHSRVPQIFQSQSIPASYIISPDDKLILRKKGAADWNSSRVRKMFDNMIH